jgi:hypothetical protein
MFLIEGMIPNISIIKLEPEFMLNPPILFAIGMVTVLRASL